MNLINRFLVSIFVMSMSMAHAQDKNIYQAFDAVLLQVKGNTCTENKLKKVIMVMPGNSNQLDVRLNVPYQSINHIPGNYAGISPESLSFNLRVDINPWKIQDELTSAKLFKTYGSLTLNNITKAVKIEYTPLPAGSEQDGDFNVSMNIQFNPNDFNPGDQDRNSKFIIKITDARVNRT
jgi:hypothetical protein